MRSETFLSLLYVWAASVTVADAKPVEQIVQLRFVSLNQSINGAGLAGADGKATPLLIQHDALSRPVPHPFGRVRLVSTPEIVARPKITGKPLKPGDKPTLPPGFREKLPVGPATKVKAGNREIGATDLPGGDHQRFIIIVHPGKGSGLTAIPDRIGFFPPGSDRYVNLTSLPVTIDLPAGRQTLPPNGTIVLRPGAANLQQYQLKLLTRSDHEEKLFFSAFAAQDDERRNLRLLIPSGAEGDDIELKSISDGLAAEDNYR